MNYSDGGSGSNHDDTEPNIHGRYNSKRGAIGSRRCKDDVPSVRRTGSGGPRTTIELRGWNSIARGWRARVDHAVVLRGIAE